MANPTATPCVPMDVMFLRTNLKEIIYDQAAYLSIRMLYKGGDRKIENLVIDTIVEIAIKMFQNAPLIREVLGMPASLVSDASYKVGINRLSNEVVMKSMLQIIVRWILGYMGWAPKTSIGTGLVVYGGGNVASSILYAL